jgi:hypothetical protein
MDLTGRVRALTAADLTVVVRRVLRDDASEPLGWTAESPDWTALVANRADRNASSSLTCMMRMSSGVMRVQLRLKAGSASLSSKRGTISSRSATKNRWKSLDVNNTARAVSSLASGANIAVVSKTPGHASISITADVYGHLVGTVASDAVNGAANLITAQCSQEVSTRSQPDV